MPDIFDELTLEEPESNSDIFDTLDYKKSPSKLSEIRRHALRSTSRIAETLLGLPSDIVQAGQGGLDPVENLASSIRKKIGLKPLEPERRPKGAPGSQELKELSGKLFGEVVKPQSELESFIDDVVSDASALALPIKGKIPFIRSIGTALAGNLSEKAAKEFGIGEKGQAAAKLGTFFLAGLTGRGTVKKYWNQQYKLAEENIPKGDKLDAFRLDRQLDKLSHELKKGGIETPSQKFVEKPLNEIKKIIHDGEMSVENAVAAKKKINELRASLFDEVKGKNAQKYARTKINDVAKYLDEALEKYGKENPQFFKHYKAANEAYAGFQQSKKAANWIKQVLPVGNFGKTGILVAEALFKPAALKATVPAYAAFKGGELATRMFKNPTLRQYYGNLMKDAINENKTGFVRNLKRIEKEIDQNEPDIFDELTSE